MFILPVILLVAIPQVPPDPLGKVEFQYPAKGLSVELTFYYRELTRKLFIYQGRSKSLHYRVEWKPVVRQVFFFSEGDIGERNAFLAEQDSYDVEHMALPGVLDHLHLTYRVEAGEFQLVVRHMLHGPVWDPMVEVQEPRIEKWRGKWNLDLRNAHALSVAAAICETERIPFEVEAGMEGKVTLKAAGLSAIEALRLVLSRIGAEVTQSDRGLHIKRTDRAGG